MVIEAVKPDWEVVLRVDGRDVCITAAFITGDDSADIVVGVEHTSAVEEYSQLLSQAAVAVVTARSWEAFTGVYEGRIDRDTKSAPF